MPGGVANRASRQEPSPVCCDAGRRAAKDYRKLSSYKQIVQLHGEDQFELCLLMVDKTLEKVPAEGARPRTKRGAPSASSTRRTA